jgi:hypothetical protein
VALGPTTAYPLIPAIGESEGAPRRITVTTPSAGAEWTQTVTGEGAWLLTAFIATFATSAVAANRTPSLSFTDGNAEILRIPLSGNVVANSSLVISGALGISSGTVGAIAGVTAVALPYIILQPGFVIRSVTPLIDVGDTYTNIRLYVFELPYGPTGYIRGPALIPDQYGDNGG